MDRPPRDASAPLLTREMVILGLFQGLGVLLLVTVGFSWAIENLDEQQSRAFGFATLVAGNLSLILANRSIEQPLWRSLRRPNPNLWWVIAGATLLLFVTLYLPGVRNLLRFEALSGPHLGLAIGLGALGLLWAEAIRWALRSLGQRLRRG